MISCHRHAAYDQINQIRWTFGTKLKTFVNTALLHYDMEKPDHQPTEEYCRWLQAGWRFAYLPAEVWNGGVITPMAQTVTVIPFLNRNRSQPVTLVATGYDQTLCLRMGLTLAIASRSAVAASCCDRRNGGDVLS